MKKVKKKCIFLRYSDVTKGYKLFDFKTNKLVVSRDVIFDEKTTWNWEDKKIENTTVLSLNQEEDEKDEDVYKGGEIPNSDNEEPPPRSTKCRVTFIKDVILPVVSQKIMKKQ